MIVKPKSLIIMIWNSIMLIPMVTMLYRAIEIFSFFLFFKIVRIEFKMKLQSSFCLEFS